ncbi:hypothetical protein [Actinomycetospora sp. NBRC 106375]|uniref:hypothetical protein n=1 Tax=Actinomycetospora sp. NBRC 106375 TaxID=3032207 RepID=UPI002555A73A|nr:hypothetical protein [Actinomycetospora sp. NBRC 106375]
MDQQQTAEITDEAALRAIVSEPPAVVADTHRSGCSSSCPVTTTPLRINGRARILAHPPFADRFTVKGTVPELAVVVDPAAWPGQRDVPSAGRIAKSQSGTHVPAAAIDAASAVDARTNRY